MNHLRTLWARFTYWLSLKCSCPTDPALYAIVLAAVFGVSGCKATKPDIERVLVPVIAECPAPNIPDRPSLPLVDLPPDATPEEIVRAYAESLEAVIGHCEQLESLLRGYTKDTPEKKND